MAKIISPWCKRAKIRLIELDMSINDLSEKTGLTRQYISSIINGRFYSEKAIKTISDMLDIDETYGSLMH